MDGIHSANGVLFFAFMIVSMTFSGPASAQQALMLEAKIPLGAVQGRIDHLAVDIARHRLFVAELGNGSVSVVDLNKAPKVIHRIAGLKEPQGIDYLPSTDTLYVASAGDGSVNLFAGSDYAAAGHIQLNDDADNVRIDRDANRVIIGYGSGGLAVIDAKSAAKIADIALKAHPEGFQLDRASNRIFVNVPDAREIAVVDLGAGRQIGSWKLPGAGKNFPMAIDEAAGTVLVAFRNPAKLVVLSEENGGVVAEIDICNDADDISLDTKRQRIHVSCGDGFLDVIELSEGTYYNVGHIPTVSGARTSLFVPELDRLFLAVRAQRTEPAAVWVFRPIR